MYAILLSCLGASQPGTLGNHQEFENGRIWREIHPVKAALNLISEHNIMRVNVKFLSKNIYLKILIGHSFESC